MKAEHQPLWIPSHEAMKRSHLIGYQTFIGKDDLTYHQLWEWSVKEIGAFWSTAWDYCGLVGSQGNQAFVSAQHMRDCNFFPQAQLNVVETLLKNADDRLACVFVGEDNRRQTITRKELKDLVGRISNALRAHGVTKGDRVTGYVPNMIESIATMMATASLGAVWSSCSPDFGVSGVEDRFGQIEPKVLFAADSYFYNGKVIDCCDSLKEIAGRIPSIEKIVVWNYAHATPQLPDVEKAVSLDDFIKSQSAELTCVPMGFRDPWYIMFSSGTTGKPKCIVHSTGGLLLLHMKEHQLQVDLHVGDRFFYFTTCGWMMWNWLVSGLASEACLILYDGNPMYPEADRLLDLAQQESVTHFGTSAKFIDACSKKDLSPKDSHNLSSLRVVMSTGSPLSEDNFRYVYSDWKGDIQLASISGGTDICGVFIGGAPTLPVYAGEIQCAHLGMDVHVFNDQGNPVIGEAGELVCCSPHPAMPVKFWNDLDGKRYYEAYFSTYDNVWRHGDYLIQTENGGFVVEGRSDATLNPGGVRIGTAEIYRQVETIPDVLEALVVGQNFDDDVRIILFVRLKEGVCLTDTLIATIKLNIRKNASPRHVPAKIIAVQDIPRTKSGKIVELAVRDIIHGKPVKNITALANPEALELYKNLPELQS